MKLRYQGVGERGIPMSMREVVLIHLENLSREIVTDGLGQEYEPALDMIMDLLHWEYVVDHSDEPMPGGGGKTIGQAYEEVMTRSFGQTNLPDKDKALRIRDKRRLLSLLLASHRIHLGRVDSYEESTLTDDRMMQLIPGGNAENGLSGDFGPEDSEIP